jgi:hypothetical protein
MLSNGLIFGRSPNLILGAFTAIFNVAVLISAQLDYPITGEIVAAVNAAAGALILVVAGNSGIQIASGAAATARANGTDK